MLRRWLGRGSRRDDNQRTDPTPERSILKVLDQGCADFVFPMLDNGYIYLAASRLSLHRSDTDWALVFEIFGFSPRAALPDVSVWSFGSRLTGRQAKADFVDQRAYEQYLAVHPHDDAAAFFPVEAGDWQDPETFELVRLGATSVTIRGRPIQIPPPEELRRHGIVLSEPPRIATFELCRYLVAVAREKILATPSERRTHIAPELAEILILDDWHHPDLVRGELASETAAFRSLAKVLATGNVDDYRPTEPPNTHWSNWPDGGTL